MMFIDPVSEIGADAVSANARMEGLLNAGHPDAGGQAVDRQSLCLISHARSGMPGYCTRPVTPATTGHGHEGYQHLGTGQCHRLKQRCAFASAKSRSLLTPLLLGSGQSALLDAKRFASATTFDSLIDETATSGQRHVIAARIEGPAYSAFPDGFKGQPPGLQKAELIQMVVVADTDLLADTLSQARPNGNAQFVLNALDNLAARRTQTHSTPCHAPTVAQAGSDAGPSRTGVSEKFA